MLTIKHYRSKQALGVLAYLKLRDFWRWRTLLVAILASVIASAPVCCWAEQVYEGKTLYQWYESELVNATVGASDGSAFSNAIYCSGSNAVPFLIDQLGQQPLKDPFMQPHIPTLGRSLQTHAPSVNADAQYEEQQRFLISKKAFFYLRPKANECVPTLISLYNSDPSSLLI